MTHTVPSRLFHSLRIQHHNHQLHASIVVLLWFYRHHSARVVERHIGRITRALVVLAARR